MKSKLTLEDKIIKLLIDEGIINELSLRDYRIKIRYKNMRNNGLSGKEARFKLSQEEYLSDKAIQRILYKRKM